MFFALKGPSFNGNKYALNAIDKGAKFAIVDEVSVPLNDKIIQVDDVLTTFRGGGKYLHSFFIFNIFSSIFNRKSFSLGSWISN